MGFARITCGVCKGIGTYKVTAGSLVPNVPMTCGNCNGEGTILTHTGAIGSSYMISTDTAGYDGDETWAILWKRMDDGSMTVVDMSKLEDGTNEDNERSDL